MTDKLRKPDINNSSSYTRNDFLFDDKHYFDYFNSLFLNNKKLTTTGDITPAYSGLPIEALKYIKENLEQKKFSTKVIFLMRDPIDRIVSQARMIIFKYLGKKNIKSDYKKVLDNVDDNNMLNELVRNLYNTQQCSMLTRYENTMHNLATVFNKKNIFYCLYEELFNDYKLNKLSDFLEISNLIFNKEIYYASSLQDIYRDKHFIKIYKDQNKISYELKEKIYNFYQNTFSICDEKFNARLFWNNYL